MITILSPEQEFDYFPIDESIKQELTKRESDKNRMIGKVPFVRLTCLQRVTYTNEEKLYKQSNYKETSETQQRENKQVDGFVLELGGNFDETYSVRQVIGKDLKNNRKIYVPNPRRVPPPLLNSFTAQNGSSAGFYTTANLQLTANSKEQLEFLTPFLLHPGNTVFVEFGYSDKNTTMNEELFSYSDLLKFEDTLVVNEKDDRVTLEKQVDKDGEETLAEFYQNLQNKVLQNKGNYEFVVGVIHNFDFKLNKDFGFDINIDLWSISKTRMSAPSKPSVNNINKKKLIDREAELRAIISQTETKQERGDWPKTTPHIVINVTTDQGKKKYIRWGSVVEYFNKNSIDHKIKLSNVNTNPFVVSNTSDVIWFNKKSIDYSQIQSTDLGNFEFNKQIVDELVKNSITLPNELIDEKTVDIQVSRQLKFEIPKVSINFEKIRPYFFDIQEPGKRGYIGNIYISVGKLITIYKNNEFNLQQTHKEITNYINNASSQCWQLKNVSTEDSVTQASFSSRNVTDENRKKTYTFKFNQKQSVVNDVTFDLGLEGIIGDQIYFESISQGESGNKLNLLLFEKHENGIEIYDYRNEKLKSVQEEFNKDSERENNISITEGDSVAGNDTIGELDSVIDTTTTFASSKNLRVFIPFAGVNSVEDFQQKLQNIVDDITNQQIQKIQGQQTRENFNQLSNQPQEDLLTKFADFFRKKFAEKNAEYGVDTSRPIEEIDLGVIQVATIETFTTVVNTTYILQTQHRYGYLKALELLGFLPTRTPDDGEDERPTLGGVNPLLESKVNITMPGLGGFRPLTFFNTDGLPDVYDKRGDFCIMDVVHTLTPTSWVTTINSLFRVNKQ